VGIYYDPTSKKWNVSYEKTDYATDLKTDYPTDFTKRVSIGFERVCEGPWYRRRCSNVERFADVPDTERNNQNSYINYQNQKENAENAAANQLNTAKNQAYDKTISVASTTSGGDYVTQRELLRNIQGLDETSKSQLEDQFKTFYTTEKLQAWDPNLGAKPAYGDFDPKYYKSINPDLEQKWKAAVANDDIDITQRYSENTYYLQHYTTHLTRNKNVCRC